ncbi:MAG: hypothetical protein AAB198_04730 [Actinomycetota bacterium]
MATIEMLTLANHVEAINGLLYLSGAGWNRVTRRYPKGGVPTPHNFGIGVSVLVPWTEANRKHHLSLRIEDEDQHEQPLLRVNGELEVGRPAGVPEGSDLRAVLASQATLQFPSAGGYRVVADLNGESRNYGFIVVDEVTPS